MQRARQERADAEAEVKAKEAEGGAAYEHAKRELEQKGAEER